VLSHYASDNNNNNNECCVNKRGRERGAGAAAELSRCIALQINKGAAVLCQRLILLQVNL